jgi:hypothetical protein
VSDIEPLSPYDPLYGAVRPPETGIFDAPTVQLCMNVEWVAFVDGVLGKLLRRGVWLGDPETQAWAVGEVQKLLIQLMQRNPCGEGEAMKPLIPTEIIITPASTFPLLLKTMAAGETVDELLLTVDEAWDAGTLSVGDAGDHEKLLSASYNSLALVDQFQVSPQYKYTAPTDVFIYLTGAPTTGVARITLYSYEES